MNLLAVFALMLLSASLGFAGGCIWASIEWYKTDEAGDVE